MWGFGEIWSSPASGMYIISLGSQDGHLPKHGSKCLGFHFWSLAWTPGIILCLSLCLPACLSFLVAPLSPEFLNVKLYCFSENPEGLQHQHQSCLVKKQRHWGVVGGKEDHQSDKSSTNNWGGLPVSMWSWGLLRHSSFHCRRVWVQSLVREIGSLMPCGMAKKLNKNMKERKIKYMCVCVCMYGASLVAQMVNNTPAMQETLGWIPLGSEDPLEKGMATDSSILAWRIPWTEEPGRLQSMGSQGVGHYWATRTCTSIRVCVCVYIYISHHIWRGVGVSWREWVLESFWLVSGVLSVSLINVMVILFF